MTVAPDRSSRREFVIDAGRLGVAGVLTACASAASPQGPSRAAAPVPALRGEWDLSWLDRLATSTDRAVFDSPAISDGIVLQTAGRYLDNCDAVYGQRGHDARIVLNVRTRAVALALNDAAWDQYALGIEYTVKDPVTQQPAVRNPFWRRAAGATVANPPTLEELVQRGAIVLVCDFALGHLSTRLATKASRSADDVHRELRSSFVPGAVAVPSGIFGLVRAQNAGCAFVNT